MADIVSQRKRSEMMRGISSSGTRPEERVRDGLRARGFRFGRAPARHGISFKPDLLLPKYRTVVLVHGCFWHRHRGCQLAYQVKVESDDSREKWSSKFRKNIARDRRNVAEVLNLGWKVLIVWECQTRKQELLKSCLDAAATWIRDGSGCLEIPSFSAFEEQAV